MILPSDLEPLRRSMSVRPTTHTEPYVLTRWVCDQCHKRCETPGAHGMSLPDESGWKQITLHSGVHTTGRYGHIHTPSKPQVRLACSLECAQLLLADRWSYVA